MSSVTLRIYDLSQGMARTLSPSILGKQIDGIWHTGIVVFNREYYFGGGICADHPGQTPYGTPHAVEQMGATEKSQAEFLDFLSGVSGQYSMTSYHLLDNNCNNFSDACCQFLLGKRIPQYILDLPSEAMNSPIGPMIRPMIEQMQSAIQQQSVGHEVSLAPDAFPHAERTDSSSSASRATRSSPPAASLSKPYWCVPVALEKANRDAVMSKMKQFAPEYKDNPEDLLSLSLTLAPEKAFPALDMLRLSVAESPGIAQHFAAEIRTIAERFILNEDVPTPACMMALRGAVNCFKDEKASARLCENDTADVLVECIVSSLTREKLQIRKTGALLALNMSGAHRRAKTSRKLDEDHSVRVLFALVERLNAAERPPSEEARPLLSALVVLVDEDPDAAMLVRTFEPELSYYTDAASCDDTLTREAASKVDKILSSH